MNVTRHQDVANRGCPISSAKQHHDQQAHSWEANIRRKSDLQSCIHIQHLLFAGILRELGSSVGKARRPVIFGINQ